MRLSFNLRKPPSRSTTPDTEQTNSDAVEVESTPTPTPSHDDLRDLAKDIAIGATVDAFAQVSSDLRDATARADALQRELDAHRADAHAEHMKRVRASSGEPVECPCCAGVAAVVQYRVKSHAITWLASLVEVHRARIDHLIDLMGDDLSELETRAARATLHRQVEVAVCDVPVSTKDYAHLALFTTQDGEPLLVRGAGHGTWVPGAGAADFIAGVSTCEQGVMTYQGRVIARSAKRLTASQVKTGGEAREGVYYDVA